MVKAHRVAFVLAYFCSLWLGLHIFQRPPSPTPAPPGPSFAGEDAVLVRYRRWLERQGASRRPLPAELLSYGPRPHDGVTEAEYLRRRVHVTCVVFAKKRRKVRAIRDTWGPRCNRLVFYAATGRRESAPEIGVRLLERPKSSWHLLCAVINEVWRTSENDLQWVVFAPEDLFVIPENLRLLVAGLSEDLPYYMGHAMTLWNTDYNVAQAGYVLSRAALEMLVRKFNSSEACETSGKHWKNEDYYLGHFLGELGVSPEDTRDSWNRGRFHGFNFNQLLFSHKLSPLGSYWKRSIFPVEEGVECCSDTSVTFQGVEPDKVYQFYYLLYHVKRFSQGGERGNLPPPTPQGEPVWRKFLRDEGLWDHPGEEISPELFYKLSEQRAFKMTLP